MGWLGDLPTRGRIVCVNFTLGGGTAWHAELTGSAQPCLVLRIDERESPPLVTLVPLVSLTPADDEDCVHRLDLKSFRGWPAPHLFGNLPRWARCSHLATVSLDRCADPSYKPECGERLSAVVRATPADMACVEMAILRALGIAPSAKTKAPQG